MDPDQLPAIYGGTCTCPQNGGKGCVMEYTADEIATE